MTKIKAYIQNTYSFHCRKMLYFDSIQQLLIRIWLKIMTYTHGFGRFKKGLWFTTENKNVVSSATNENIRKCEGISQTDVRTVYEYKQEIESQVVLSATLFTIFLEQGLKPQKNKCDWMHIYADICRYSTSTKRKRFENH